MTAPQDVAHMVCPGLRLPPLEATRSAVMLEPATLALANAHAMMATLGITAAERLAQMTAAVTESAKL